jgi:transcriptional regulator with GAF, ATPase, and Fis domain
MRALLATSSSSKPWVFTAESTGRKGALDLARRVAASRCPVLIIGATGVGKDVLAEDIHHHSHRAGRFVAVNCAAIAPGLFENEFFGHDRGAYTGAMEARPGFADLADGGTLFLDEVGELPLAAQAKLLRFLGGGTFWPVGAPRERSADVRIIAATNRDLRAMAGDTFREDLFFRLSVVTVAVPPLTPSDIRLLARVFAADLSSRAGVTMSGRDLDALAAVAGEQSFRGGARELRNALERYLLLRDPELTPAENWRLTSGAGAPDERRSGGEPGVVTAGDPGAAMQQLDDLAFLTAARSSGNVRELSQQTNRSLQTVYERLKRLGIKPQDVGRPDAMDRAVAQAHRAMLPHKPWIQDLLNGFPET